MTPDVLKEYLAALPNGWHRAQLKSGDFEVTVEVASFAQSIAVDPDPFAQELELFPPAIRAQVRAHLEKQAGR